MESPIVESMNIGLQLLTKDNNNRAWLYVIFFSFKNVDTNLAPTG